MINLAAKLRLRPSVPYSVRRRWLKGSEDADGNVRQTDQISYLHTTTHSGKTDEECFISRSGPSASPSTLSRHARSHRITHPNMTTSEQLRLPHALTANSREAVCVRAAAQRRLSSAERVRIRVFGRIEHPDAPLFTSTYLSPSRQRLCTRLTNPQVDNTYGHVHTPS